MFILFGWCSETGIWNTSIDIVQSKRRIYRFISFIPFCRFSLRCLQITTRLDQILLVTFCLLISGWLHLISRSIYQVCWKLRLNSVQSNTGMIGVPVTQPPGQTCPTPTVLEEELYYKLWCCRCFFLRDVSNITPITAFGPTGFAHCSNEWNLHLSFRKCDFVDILFMIANIQTSYSH